MKKTFKTAVVLAVIGGGAAVGGAVATTAMQSVQFANAQRQVSEARASLETAGDISGVFKTVGRAVEPAVVSIQTKSRVPNPANQMRRFFRFGPEGMTPESLPTPEDQQEEGLFTQGTGSGVVMLVEGREGYILTNNHVVDNATEFTITLQDGRTVTEATVVGTDPRTDLAVLKIKADRLIAANWGESEKLEKGDWVVAFGSPFGYVGSMTTGIVSALNRQVGILGATGFEDFIQTDAAINPGNSGGPLVNLRGEVVGINTAIASRTGGFNGIGFAVPTRIARPVFERLRTEGRIARGWLGIEIDDVRSPVNPDTKQAVEATGFKGEEGVFVAATRRDGPASGVLQPSDIVLSVDGKAVKSVRELRETISAKSPGTEVTLKVFREGKEVEQKVKLGELPTELQLTTNDRGPAARGMPEQAMGLMLRALTPQLAERYGLDASEQGAVVTGVTPMSAAARAGLREGDVITRVDGKNVTSAADAAEALRAADLKKGVRLMVSNREGSRMVMLREGR